MIEISVNNQLVGMPEEATVAHVVEQHASQGPFAVALNGQFVSKAQYQTTKVSMKDKIDILSPIQGG